MVQVLSNGTPILNLDIEDGSMLYADRASLIRRTTTCLLTDPNETLVASTAAQILTPYGNEFSVYYGVTFDDGTQEFILQGIFGIVDVGIDDSGGDLRITLDGSDRSRAVQRDLFTDTFTIPPGTNIGLAIQSIILSRNVSPLVQQFNFAPTPFTTPSTPIVYLAGDDPLDAIANPQTGLAAMAGMQFFYDPNGIATLVPIPDPTLQPTWWPFDEGNQNIAVELNRTLSSANAFNTVVVEGSGTGTGGLPIQATAQDTTSPIAVAKVGEWVDYQSSSLVSSNAQAQVVANARLLIDKASVETVTITSVVVPDVDIDNVAEATRVRAGVAAQTRYVVDSFSIGLGTSGVLAANARLVA